jgi:hypothetical protein
MTTELPVLVLSPRQRVFVQAFFTLVLVFVAYEASQAVPKMIDAYETAAVDTDAHQLRTPVGFLGIVVAAAAGGGVFFTLTEHFRTHTTF